MAEKTQSVSIVYQGEALDDHKMDILAFSKSLQGLGEAIYAANEIVNGGRDIEVNVDAELIAGSFGFDIEIIQHLANAKDVIQILGLSSIPMALGGATVLEVLKKLNGRKIDIVETEAGGDKVKLKVDGEEIVCSEDVEKIVNAPEVRKAVDAFVRQPLLRPGIENFVVKESRTAKKDIINIAKDEADEFKSPRVLFETKEESDEFESTVTFISAHTDKKSGWRVEFNGEKCTVRMEDDEFIKLVTGPKAPKVFGELFAVKMKKVTKDSGGQVDEKLSIIKVGRHFTDKAKKIKLDAK
ncbi:hypothetical protein HKT11_01840 [Serratia marcescens]|uniref:hypothetical protein n=1 Tax=Serratia marcescens TaxID=615 RepID=UPI0015604C99|nr:hypothetical protein [Serratia marcescens]NRN18104.1 hypothetical protein [Serratia marcescens]NRN22328.1 hypothetical protein [Serratia marcescens]NRN55552.1 hypothetical protein [Serratia marcescens]